MFCQLYPQIRSRICPFSLPQPKAPAPLTWITVTPPSLVCGLPLGPHPQSFSHMARGVLSICRSEVSSSAPKPSRSSHLTQGRSQRPSRGSQGLERSMPGHCSDLLSPTAPDSLGSRNASLLTAPHCCPSVFALAVSSVYEALLLHHHECPNSSITFPGTSPHPCIPYLPSLLSPLHPPHSMYHGLTRSLFCLLLLSSAPCLPVP